MPTPKVIDDLGHKSAGFSYSNITQKEGSGDADFDQALARTLLNLSDMFEILPGFAFRVSPGMNAYATTRREVGNRADGSVVFGIPMFREIMKRPENPEIGIAAICAHEFAHILQFKRGIRPKLVGADGHVKRLELHADYLAGYFAGRRKLEKASFPAAVFAATQYSFGDNAYGSPDHHGTEQERGAAVVAGFKAAYRSKYSVSEAIESGIQYVMTI